MKTKTRAARRVAVVLLLGGAAAAVARAADRPGEELIKAAIKGNLAQVRALLDAGADPNQADKDGKTALWEAARHDKPDVVELLLGRSADAERATKDGDTPLLQGARKGHARVVELLLRAEPGQGARHRNDRLLLMTAAEGGSGDVVRQLVELGADVDASGADGETPMFAAARNGKGAAIEALAAAHARVDLFSARNLTPLMEAARLGRPEAVHALLRAGAYPNLRNDDDRGWTAMMYAAAGSSSGVIDELAEGGAAVNVEDAQRDLPIHVAARLSNGSVVRALIVHGADVNCRSGSDRKTPLEIAVENGDRDVAGQLVDGGACVTAAVRARVEAKKDEKMMAVLGGARRRGCGRF